MSAGGRWAEGKWEGKCAFRNRVSRLWREVRGDYGTAVILNAILSSRGGSRQCLARPAQNVHKVASPAIGRRSPLRSTCRLRWRTVIQGSRQIPVCSKTAPTRSRRPTLVAPGVPQTLGRIAFDIEERAYSADALSRRPYAVHLKIGRSAVRQFLKDEGLTPSPIRRGKAGKTTWQKFIQRHVNTLVACDFFTKSVITPLGTRIAYSLAFIHIGTRKVFLSPPPRIIRTNAGSSSKVAI